MFDLATIARRAATLALVTIGLLALGPAAATAATVGVEGDTLVYRAAPGEGNALTARYAQAFGDSGSPQGPRFYFFQQGGGPGDEEIRAALGRGCEVEPGASDDRYIRCSSAGVSRVLFDMGDGDDSLSWDYETEESQPGSETSLPAAETVRGGTGDDDLFGHRGSRSSVIYGGGGKDAIRDATTGRGGEGNDRLEGRFGSASTLYGEGGRDQLLGNETDYIQLDGRGPRVYVGPLRAYAGPGKDSVSGGRFADRLNGGAGNDRMAGGRGRDRLIGGSGNDSIASDEQYEGVGRRARDKVACGRGRDRVFADRLDRHGGCERVFPRRGR
ncbi:MAG: calcium-binding protein [Solirubrobacteraceae bacterium]